MNSLAIMLRSTSAKAPVTCPWLDALFNGCLPSVLPAQNGRARNTHLLGADLRYGQRRLP
jgi:hypothetical protein